MRRLINAKFAVLFTFIVGFLLFNSDEGTIGFAQQTLPTLILTDFQFESPADGTPDYYLELGEQANLRIRGTLRNESNVQASNFNIVFSLRSEDPDEALDVFPSGFICSRVGTGSCTNVTIGANQSLEVTGQLIVDGDSPAGRYFVDVSIDDFGVTLSPTSIDQVDILLVVGADRPEYHPVSLSFSPPSPVPPNSVLTIRTTIENTGLPAVTDEILFVQFEYCPVLNNIECTDSQFRTTGFSGTGRLTLTGDLLANLRIGRDLIVTNRLDTDAANLSAGSYIVKVSILTRDETLEEDEENNEITTFFRIRGNVGSGICTVQGEVTTLGEATGQIEGQSQNAQLLFVASQDNGNTVLHTLDAQIIKNSGDTIIGDCPSVVPPRNLNAAVSAFEFDNRANLLYIGLVTGELVIVDFSLFPLDADMTPTLSQQSTNVATNELLSLWNRPVSSTSSQLLVGSRTNQLFKLNINRIAGTQNVTVSRSTCESETLPVQNVQIFRGNVYYTSGDTLFRFSQSVCGNRAIAVFDGNSTITALDLTQVDDGSGIGARIAVGLNNGEVHILDIFGSLVTPIVDFDSQITALASNTDVAAQAVNGEVVFVGTESGIIDRIQLENGERCIEPFQTPDQTAITVLETFEPDETGAFTDGLAFVSTEDNLVIVLDDSCAEFAQTETATGAISSNILIESETSLDPITFEEPITSVIFTYAVGSDIVRKRVGGP